MFGVGATTSLPADDAALYLKEDAAQITICRGAELVLTYNKLPPNVPPGIDSVYQRSGLLHPVASPNGGVVTALYPADHAHQNGIFSAWVQTKYDGQTIDFWNLAKRSGRVTHNRVVGTFADSKRAGLEVELLHQVVAETPVDVLHETWKVTCFQSRNEHVFDIESTQQALTDEPLVIEEYHYGGMALRGPSAWILPRTSSSPTASNALPTSIMPTSIMLNSQGSGRADGNHQAAKWVAMSGMQNGQAVYVAVLSHPDNFRAPQPARLHPTKPYFCFASCVRGEFVIDKSTPLRSRYRFIVADGRPEMSGLDKKWAEWTAAEQQ